MYHKEITIINLNKNTKYYKLFNKLDRKIFKFSNISTES